MRRGREVRSLRPGPVSALHLRHDDQRMRLRVHDQRAMRGGPAVCEPELRPQAQRRPVRERQGVHLGVLRRRGVLQLRLQWPMRLVQPARFGGSVQTHRGGSAGPGVRGGGSQHLRQDRVVRRLWRLLVVSREYHLHAGLLLRRRAAQHGSDVRWSRDLSGRPAHGLLPLPVQQRRLQSGLRHRCRLRAWHRLRERRQRPALLRQETERTALRRRQRVQLRAMRGRSVLREQLRRPLPQL